VFRKGLAAETERPSPTAAKSGGLMEASGYLPLNNGERQFVPECLAPQRVFELQFTAPETTPPGIVF